jgi:hypothetical protein
VPTLIETERLERLERLPYIGRIRERSIHVPYRGTVPTVPNLETGINEETFLKAPPCSYLSLHNCSGSERDLRRFRQRWDREGYVERRARPLEQS